VKRLLLCRVEINIEKKAEQINGREGETATLFGNLSVKLGVAWWRFRPTSSQPLAVSCSFDRFNKFSARQSREVLDII
jgi:hypothetical protein